MLLQTPKGTKDILPEDQKYYNFIQEEVEKQSEINGFEKIETPLFEYASLYTRALGEDSDVVEKEMYQVSRFGADNDAKKSLDKARDKEKIVLRPEYTAGIVRSYIEHGMINQPQPVQLYYMGPVFRYSKPQKGRLRQFWQVGFELIGAPDPSTDARLISLVYSLGRSLRLKNLTLLVNSIGDKKCRPNLKAVLKDYYSKKRAVLCDDCQKRIDNNPFRLLDCKNPSCQKLAKSAPPLIDYLCVACKDHFKQTLEFLDEAEVPYDIDPHLVRGLDYYTKTVFELVQKNDTKRQNSIAGGGRYDELIEQYDQKATPAIGVSFGVERIINLLKSQKIKIVEAEKPQVFIAQLGEEAKKKTLNILEILQKDDIKVRSALSKSTLKSQLKLADKLDVKVTIIVGQREVLDGTVILRDMKEGIQEVVEYNKFLKRLKERLDIKK